METHEVQFQTHMHRPRLC